MAILIFLLGMITGSILNFCIYTIPRYDGPNKWYDSLSFLNILFCRKLRYCNYSIFFRNLIVELLTGIIFVLLFNKFKWSMDFIVYTFLSTLLVIIAIIDIDYQIIPDNLVILIFLIAIIYEITNNHLINLLDNIIALILSGLLFTIIFIVSKGGIGGGDIKLIGVLGFILGIPKIFLSIFLSFLLGAVASIVLLSCGIRNRKDVIPFGPFIVLSFLITSIWGEEIIHWYIYKLLT